MSSCRLCVHIWAPNRHHRHAESSQTNQTLVQSLKLLRRRCWPSIRYLGRFLRPLLP